ncbi:MAG TPA: DUF2300 domain-containing protein [Methylomirabilota bacterium]
MHAALGLVLILLLAAPAAATAGTARGDASALELAWRRDGVDHYQLIGADARLLDPTLTTPLGSVWKLFVHVYITSRGVAAPDYACGGGDPKEEGFCCVAGASVGADEALARSCGLFFEPARLGITPEAWRTHWSAWGALPPEAEWLLDLHRLRPDTTVTVASLLQALAAVPPAQRAATEHALLSVVLRSDPSVVQTLGGTARVKTWTWSHPAGGARHAGGVAGWLADGTPVWARGDGAGIHVLTLVAPALAILREARPAAPESVECVVVDFFARYPLREVTERISGAAAPAGPLRGAFTVSFVNGNTIGVESEGELVLTPGADGPTLVARLDLEEYVARVIDREAAGRPEAAARALAVVARTYVFQEGRFERGCRRIDDSTQAQRVAPRRATAGARAAGTWTAGLVLDGVTVTYHSSEAGPNRLSWTQAVELARAGWTFEAILARAYPAGRIVPFGEARGDGCQRLDGVERWLAARAARFRERLVGEPGFESPAALRACRLAHARPYADAERGRIYVRGLGSAEERLAAVHEYLHVAFHRHPRGLDEAFIERLARELERTP